MHSLINYIFRQLQNSWHCISDMRMHKLNYNCQSVGLDIILFAENNVHNDGESSKFVESGAILTAMVGFIFLRPVWNAIILS